MANNRKLNLRDANRIIVAREIEIGRLNKVIQKLERELKVAEKMATHDHLTGLLNRRGGDEVLAHHFSILERDNCEKNNFAVLNLDLDRFKGINDTYGHDVGDDVIKFFGDTLTSVLRDDYDVVVRMGGDEFMIILPESSFEQAEIVKAKVKNALAVTPFISKDIKLSLRTSVGVGMARSTKGNISSLKKILIRADKEMFKDKEEGRQLRHP